MGGSFYKNIEKQKISEALVMKRYLEKNFKKQLKNTKIITEEKTTSTVEQICFLKKLIKKEKFLYSDVVIVSSKFFGNRVKLYTEYILGTNKGIIFLESKIPKNLEARFKKVEEGKLKVVQNWFKKHKKGDDKKILKEQKIFQRKVKEGKINQPVS
jgi:hypothetical protein